MSINAGQITAEAQLDVSQVDTATAKVVASVEKINQSFTQIRTPQISLTTGDLDAKTQAASTSLNNLAQKLTGLPVGKIGLDVGNAEQAAGTFNKLLTGITGSIGGTTTALGGLTAALGTGGLVAAAGLAVGALLKLGQQYEDTFRKIAVQTGATGEALESLRASMEKIGTNSVAPLERIGAVLITVRQRTGELGTELEGTTQALLKFSKATGSDAVQNAESLTRIFNAFKVSVQEQTGVLDAFVQVQQKTGISTQALQQGVLSAGAVLRQFGLDAKESAALIGALDQAGIDSQQVVLGLRRALGSVVGPEAKQQIFDLIASLGNADDQVLATQKAFELFGPRAGAALLDAARSGKLSLETINTILEGSGGTVSRAAEQVDSAAERLAKAAQKAERAWTPVAVAMAEAASDMLTNTLDALNKVGAAIDEFLASDRVRNLAGVLVQLADAAGKAPARVEAAVTETVAGATAAAPTPGQVEGAAEVGAAAARVAALGSLTDAEKELVAVHQQRLAAEEAFAAADAAQQEAMAAAQVAMEGQTEAITQQDAAYEAWLASVAAVPTAVQTTAEAQAAAAAATDALLQSYLKAKDGVVNYAAALAAGGTQHQAFIEQVLTEQQAAERLDSSIKQLTDTHVKAEAITLQHAAAQATGAERAQLLAQAQGLVTASLGPQQQATERIGALLTAVLPNLDAATAATAKYKTEQEQLAIVAQATGQSQEQVAASIAGTGAAAAEAAKHAAALSKGFAGFLTDEDKSRWTSTVGSLTSAVNDTTAAQAKFLEATDKSKDALDLLLGAIGAGAQAKQLEQQLLAGGAAAQDAKEKIAALTTFVREHGQLVLKIDVDIANAQKAIGDLQRDFREANAQRASDADKAARAFDAGQLQAQATRDQVQTDFKTSMMALNQARADSQAQVGRDIAKTATAANDAAIKLAQAADDAWDKHQTAIGDAQDKYVQTVADAQKTFGQGLESLADRTRAILQQVADAAASALRSQASAMQSFNDQQRQAANQASITAENVQTALFAAQPGFDPDNPQTKANAANVAAVQAQGTAALAQQGQANALNQTLQASNQALRKATQDATVALNKLDQDMKKLNATYQATVDKAGQTQDKAVRDADTAQDLAERNVNQAMAKNTAAFDAAQTKALDDNRTRQKAIDDQQQAAQQQFFKALMKETVERGQDPKQQGRTKAEVEFDQAEADRRKAQADAEKRFKEQMDKLDDQLENLRAIRVNTGRSAGPDITFGTTTIQETSKDMLTKAQQVAQRLLRV